LRYGIPNFKLEKGLSIDVAILEAEGIIFKTILKVNYTVEQLNQFDSVVLCGGSTERRSLPTKGIETKGVVQAMDFLSQQTKVLYGETILDQIKATGKDVLLLEVETLDLIVWNFNRHGKSVTNFEMSWNKWSTPGHNWPLQLKNIIITRGRM
jgi:glutamate synthase (NADPH/NADH) small chain